MKERKIEKNLKKNELSTFLEQCKEKGDCFSIARYYHGYISPEEFEAMQNAFYDTIIENHQKRIHDYQNNTNGYKDELDRFFHFQDEKAAQDYFEELFNQEMEVYEEFQYCEFASLKEEPLDIPSEWLIKRDLTRMTPVTVGPVFEMLTLSIDAFDEVVSHMKKLFSTYHVFGYEFEDLCCYCDGNVILKICSHEKYAFYYEE